MKILKRKTLAALLALSLLASLLPLGAQPALAADGDTVYVGGEALTGTAGAPVYATTDESGNVSTEGASDDNYNIKWDGSTLTLKNAYITNAAHGDSYLHPVEGAAIGVANSSGDAELTIQLESGNTIEDVSLGIWVYSSGTGYASLTITGSGSLKASGSSSGILVQSNSGDATLSIKNAEVTAENSSFSGDGVTVRAGETSNASLTVDGGQLTATGSGNDDAGIRYTFGGSSSGSGKPSLTVSENAIVKASGGKGGISTNSSTATEIKSDSETTNGGIVFDGTEGTVYGNVTLQEDLTIGEGESLTLDSGASLDAGDYDVIVDGGTLGAGLEEALGDNVKYPPTITTTTLTDGRVGEPYSTSLGADGTAPITWSVSGSLPAGLSLNGNTISGTPTTAGTSTFTVTATNGYGDGDSEALSITINPAALSITTQPSNQSVTEGQTASFSVAATGNGTLTYQWQESTDGSTWTNIDGANAATYTIENTTTAMSGYQYRCVVTDGNSTEVASQAATLTVTAATVPVTGVTLNKTSANLTVGGTVILNATITPSDATNKNVTWSSSDSSIVTVGADQTDNTKATVKALKEGSATITVTTEDGNKTATCTVTVKEPPYTGKYSYELSTSVGDHGSLTVDRYATEGEKVTITVTPDEAYKLDDLSVTAGGKEVTLTAGGDGTFSFTMPSADVKITATFAEDPDWSEPEEPATDVSDIFIDVAPNAWYKDAVQYAYDSGLMTGVSANEFAPEATTTRAMIVSMLARLEGVESAESAGFSDVSDSDWYATAVNWAAASGITSGTGDGNFSPNTAITREQLAAILMNYAQYKGQDVSARATLDTYNDATAISSWANDVMSWAVAEGLISGVTADTLQPQGAATRAQVAAILQRFLSE